MMFRPHQADAVRLALRKGLGQEDPATGLDARLRDALADTGRARFTADQKDDVKSALRSSEEKNLRVDLGAALADTGRARFTADQKDDVKSALRSCDEKNLRVDLGAALAGPDGLPTTDVDGPAMLPMPPAVQEPPMPPKEPLVPEPTSPKVGAGMDGSAHSFQGYGRKVSADGGDPTFCWSL